jgi:HAE1 family hydrophobic/amphiphilic exporter-1
VLYRLVEARKEARLRRREERITALAATPGRGTRGR